MIKVKARVDWGNWENPPPLLLNGGIGLPPFWSSKCKIRTKTLVPLESFFLCNGANVLVTQELWVLWRTELLNKKY